MRIKLKLKFPDAVVLLVCVLFVLAGISFLLISFFFSDKTYSPNFLGGKIYVVRTDNFPLIKKGEAAISEKVSPTEIIKGNIIVFKNPQNEYGLAEISTTRTEFGLTSFTAIGESGNEINIDQGMVVGKVTHKSRFIGGAINFARSSVGLLFIAFLPCLAMLIHEIRRAVREYHLDKSSIIPTKKQYEEPTYTPKKDNAVAPHEEEISPVPFFNPATRKSNNEGIKLSNLENDRRKEILDVAKKSLDNAKKAEKRTSQNDNTQALKKLEETIKSRQVPPLSSKTSILSETNDLSDKRQPVVTPLALAPKLKIPSAYSKNAVNSKSTHNDSDGDSQ